MTKTIKANYNFEIDQVGNDYHITYSKDKFGAGLGCGIFFLVTIGVVPALSFMLGTTNSVTFWIVAPIALTILIIYLIKKSRKDKTFTIGKNFIGAHGNNYAKADIKKIYIKDPKGNVHRTTNNGRSGFIIGGSGMGAVAVGAASVASSGARATSEIMNSAIHKASYKIEFLYGNKKVALATGLSENNAFVLFDKVMELLN